MYVQYAKIQAENDLINCENASKLLITSKIIIADDIEIQTFGLIVAVGLLRSTASLLVSTLAANAD